VRNLKIYNLTNRVKIVEEKLKGMENSENKGRNGEREA
jgi:hypothetical protein